MILEPELFFNNLSYFVKHNSEILQIENFHMNMLLQLLHLLKDIFCMSKAIYNQTFKIEHSSNIYLHDYLHDGFVFEVS